MLFRSYTFNLSKADKNADKNLESVSISGTVNGEKVTYTGVKDATGNFTITVPYSLGTGAWDTEDDSDYTPSFALTNWTVSAIGTAGQTLTFTGVSDSDWETYAGDTENNTVTKAGLATANVIMNSGTTVMAQLFAGVATTTAESGDPNYVPYGFSSSVDKI